MRKVKFEWEIVSNDTYLIINLNGELNSMIPLSSNGLAAFKAEKKSEIEFFDSFTKATVKGLDLLN